MCARAKQTPRGETPDSACAPELPPRFFEWRDDWTLDVGFMDEDHRLLASMLNRIARDFGAWPGTLPRDGDAPVMLAALEDLGRHVREHFGREEEVMRTLGYPDYPAHKGEHTMLLAEYGVLVREIRGAGQAALDVSELNALKAWLMGHVLDADRRLADFLKSPDNGVPEQAG
jgi:hemerythrin-like metal-binding protein